MKKYLTLCIAVILFQSTMSCYGQNLLSGNSNISADKVQALKDTLQALYNRTANTWLKLHCESITRVINSKQLSSLETSFIENLYDAFIDETNQFSPADINTYLQRRRPLILSWVSPSDGSVSLSWLKLPRNWVPGTKYPVYIELHGLWNVASNPFQYMVYPFSGSASYNNAFEDGFQLSPWGRGNYWYQGSSETDIWECLAALENLAQIDSSRKYLCGHSMGGYGAMTIAAKSPGVWAAVGIYAGALGYYPSPLNQTVYEALKDVPMYFVCGTRDNLYEVNTLAYNMIGNEGNKNIRFTSFDGGHDYREGDVFAMYMWMKNFVNDNFITRSGRAETRSFSYTNPVVSTLEIRYPQNLIHDTLIYIYDLTGKVVYTAVQDEVSNGSFSADVSALIPGTYILKLIRNEWSESGILVKL